MAYLYSSGSLSHTGEVTVGNGLTVSAGTVALPNSQIGTAEIADDAVTKAKIASDIAGSGLEQHTDGSIRLATAAAGDGLSGGGGSALAVSVDDSSIEIADDAIRVKASGVTNAMLAGSIANAKLANSTISGVALGANLNALTKATNSGLAMSSYNGSAAVSDLAMDLNDLSDSHSVNVAADSFAFIDADQSNATKKDTIADLMTAVAGVGLAASSGVLALNLNELSPADVNLSADSLAILDGDGNATRKESFADLMDAMVAGSNSGMAVSPNKELLVNVAGLSAVESIASGDTFAFAQEAQGGDPTKKVTIDNIAAKLAGDGIAAASGVLAVGVDDSSIELNSDALRVKASGVTNAMLAGSIANAKLANSAITIAGASTALGGSITSAAILNVDFGGNYTIGTQSDDVATFGGGVIVTGDLTVNGTTTTVNSTTVTIDDPMFTLGGDTAPGSDDNKDRGIEFRYYDGSAKLGFMGWDDSEKMIIFAHDVSNTSEVISVSKYADLRAGSVIADDFEGRHIWKGADAVKTSNYEIDPMDVGILGDSSSGNITLTLPNMGDKSPGRQYNIKNVGTANKCVVNTGDSKLIDGVASVDLGAKGAATFLACSSSAGGYFWSVL